MKLIPLFFLLVTPLWSDFEAKVLPIIKKSCVECHQPHMKRGKKKDAKSGLRLDSAFGISQGSDDGAAIVRGKPSESPFYTLAALDPDDDDIMPPKGDALTKEELQIIKTWIEKGADFGKWRGVNKAEPQWPKEAKEIEKKRKEIPALPQKASYDFKKLPFTVRPIAAKSPYLEVELRGNGEKIKSSDLRVLSLYGDNIVRVHLEKISLDTEAMKNLVKINALEVLSLTNCDLPSLKALPKLKNLQALNLYASKAPQGPDPKNWSGLKHFTPLGI